jgi:uncharacterized repeat protein (TIGR01451 family)
LNLVKTSSESTAKANDTITYTLQYSNPGSSPAMNVTIIDNLPPTASLLYAPGSASNGGTYDPVANTLTWVIPLIPGGATVPLSYQEAIQPLAGQLNPVVNCAKLSFAGGQVTSCASVSILGSYVVQVSVYNSAGELIKTLSTFEAVSSVSAFTLSTGVLTSDSQVLQIITNGQPLGTWNGTNGTGQKVTNGSYFIKVSSTDPFGVTSTVSQTVSVNISRSTLTAEVFNEAGEVVKHFSEADIQAMIGGANLTASDFDVAQVKLSSGVLAPSYSGTGSSNSVLTITLGSGASFTWDGKGDNGIILSPGNYFLEVQSTGPNGQSVEETTRTVRIDGAVDAINGFVLGPNPIRLSQTQSANFFINTDAAQVTSTDVKIYTIAGELISKPALINLPGNPGVVPWNLSQFAIASGTYIAVVELNTANGTIGRKFLKVVVIR